MNRPTILIGGGYDKDSEYDEWIKAFDGKVRKLVLLDATIEKIAQSAHAVSYTHLDVYKRQLGYSFVICNGLEGCLFVYSQEEWNKFVAELETLPRMSKDARIFKRYFFGSASEGSFDKQGRVLVPPSLRKAAGLEKDVVLVGVRCV